MSSFCLYLFLGSYRNRARYLRSILRDPNLFVRSLPAAALVLQNNGCIEPSRCVPDLLFRAFGGLRHFDPLAMNQRGRCLVCNKAKGEPSLENAYRLKQIVSAPNCLVPTLAFLEDYKDYRRRIVTPGICSHKSRECS